MKIFSYGSNLSSARLRARVSSARLSHTGYVLGHSLRFHKKGRLDASGKANMLHTGSEANRVWGVVWTIDPVHKPDLDRVEGLGAGYDEEVVSVRLTAGGRPRRAEESDRPGPGVVRARTYVADPAYIDDRLLPYDWYLAFVLAGAREHGLPDGYVSGIESRESERDPDAERRKRNRRILERGAGRAT